MTQALNKVYDIAAKFWKYNKLLQYQQLIFWRLASNVLWNLPWIIYTLLDCESMDIWREKNCYQAFEFKNSSQSTTIHTLNQNYQLGKGIKQFNQEHNSQAGTYSHARHYYDATSCRLKLLLIQSEVISLEQFVNHEASHESRCRVASHERRSFYIDVTRYAPV